MLIFKYLFRETFKSQIAVFFILMAIFITLRFVRILGDATDGNLPSELVLGFITLYSPMLASLVLPISLFLGIMLAYGRLYVDSEMTVLRACGVSEWYVTRVTLFFSIVLALITAAVTLYLAPLAMEREFELQQEANAKSGLAALIPGRFQQIGEDDTVIFAHDNDDDELKKVFLSRQRKENEQMQFIYASIGTVEDSANGEQNLVLKGGHQYQVDRNQNDFHIVKFDAYSIVIDDVEGEQARKKMAAIPTLELAQIPGSEAAAELQWRIAIPLSLPFLVLIAVPLSSVDPRQGRFGKMLPALLLYLGYFLLLLASRRILEDGNLPIAIGLWWVHALMATIGFALIAKDRKTGAYIRKVMLRGRNV
ncbi:MAG: LPS export ABC transporter permease LptF [Pseudomonadota bacterium]